VQHYLLVYDRREGRIVRRRRFDDPNVALTARFTAEREFRDAPDMEIVVLGAESLAALRQTHARYFKRVQELAGQALEREASLA
jgi:hypothetical protein